MMNKISERIKELEKEIEKTNPYTPIELKKELLILNFAKSEHDKFIQKLKEEIETYGNRVIEPYDILQFIDELNTQQEQMGDKRYTMSEPSSASMERTISECPNCSQKHTPAENTQETKPFEDSHGCNLAEQKTAVLIDDKKDKTLEQETDGQGLGGVQSHDFNPSVGSGWSSSPVKFKGCKHLERQWIPNGGSGYYRCKECKSKQAMQEKTK